MKVVIAIDSYKGCMSSLEAGLAARAGVLAVWPDAEVKVYQVADGGEGTVEALSQTSADLRIDHEDIDGEESFVDDKSRIVDVMVTGPLGDKIHTGYSVIPEKKLAIIEMASAAGLTLVPQEKRNPLYTTTYGVGEMIRHAVENGYRKFVIGIGGSATNDGGVGMLQALGYRFVDAKGKDISYGVNGLKDLSNIYMEDAMLELNSCQFKIACDVDNPLLGERGCSRVFASQKGAGKDEIELCEQAMTRYANLVEHIAMCGESELHHVWKLNARVNAETLMRINEQANETQDVTINDKADVSGINRNFPGAGAAGGLGYGFMMFLPSKLEPGIEIVLDEIEIEKDFVDADMVITGEGCFDEQSLGGKTPIGVCKRAKKYGKPVFIFAGKTTNPSSDLVDGCYAISEHETDLERAMKKEVAMENMTVTVKNVLSAYNEKP